VKLSHRVSIIERSLTKIVKRSETPSFKYDPYTGEPLFKPKIGREPKLRKREHSQSIGEYLYKNGKTQRDLLDEKRAKFERENRKFKNKPELMEKSKEMVNNLRNATFKKIFSILDSDQDGNIDAQYIDLSSIFIFFNFFIKV